MYDPWNDFSLSIRTFFPSLDATLHHLWWNSWQEVAKNIFIWHQNEVYDGESYIFIKKNNLVELKVCEIYQRLSDKSMKGISWWKHIFVTYILSQHALWKIVIKKHFYNVPMLPFQHIIISQLKEKSLCKMFFQSFFYCVYWEKNDGCKAKMLLTVKEGKINPTILVLIPSLKL